MIASALLLLIGLVLIIQGGDLFVSSSVRIAEFLRMPRVVIGSTLVSLATTTPEITVSILSGVRGESGLAVGNAVGSCVCNLGLILGVLAALKHIEVHARILRTPLLAMAFCGVLLLWMTWNLRVSRVQGAFLLALGAGYFLYDFWFHKRNARPADMVEARAIESEMLTRHSWLQTRWGTALQFLFGAILVVAGSKLLVDAAVHMATLLGVPSILVGLTVVAIGTSLPELITAITSTRRNVSDLAVGNVLGANIANLTLIIGSASSLHEVTMSRATHLYNFPALLIGVALVTGMVVSGNSISRRQGTILLGFYLLYMTGLITLTIIRFQEPV